MPPLNIGAKDLLMIEAEGRAKGTRSTLGEKSFHLGSLMQQAYLYHHSLVLKGVEDTEIDFYSILLV